MKHIKTYEDLNIPQIGDYVICKNDSQYEEDFGFDEFISENIGQIVNTDETHEYFVQYENVPHDYDLLNYAFFTTDRTFLKGLKFRTLISNKNKYSNITSFKLDEIIDFSPNKKDLEIKIASRKYNL